MIDSNYFILTKLIMIVAVVCIAIMIITIIIRAKDKTKKYKGDHMARHDCMNVISSRLFAETYP